ncbi:NFIL3 like protein [Tiliqua scincoides]|uniref:NFIL3 like protein n=1 Tax=Tiliqua scincoides TaxID=71010 RepID=UPI003462AE12
MEHFLEPAGAFGELTIRCNNKAILPCSASGPLRRKREFTPEEKKDTVYWEKRLKNNEAARRSRERRRFNDFAMESQVIALREENLRLRVELLDLKTRFGLINLDAHTPCIQDIRNVKVHSLLQDGCWFTAPHSTPLTQESTDFMYKGITSRELLNQDPKDIPSVKHYDVSSWGAKSHSESTFTSTFSPTYLNYHLLQNYSYHFPVPENSHLPPVLPNKAEMGKEDPQITSDEDVQQVIKIPSHRLIDTSENPQVVQTALPHKLRIKTKNFNFWDDGSISGHHKPVGEIVGMDI